MPNVVNPSQQPSSPHDHLSEATPASRHQSSSSFRISARTESQFRADLVLAIGLFELLITVVHCTTELAWGSPALGKLYALGLAAIAVTLIGFRRGASPRVIGNLLIAILFALTALTNVLTGGRAIGANIALPTLALFAVMMSTRRDAMLWLALIAVQIMGMAWLRRSGMAFPVHPNPSWVSSAIDRVPLFFSLGAALAGWMAMRALDQYRSSQAEAREAETAARNEASSLAQRFADFAEVAADGFWETDAELRLTFVSPSFARAMGMQKSAMLGKTPGDAYLTRFPDAPRIGEFMAPLERHEAFADLKFPTQDREGRRVLLHCLGRPFLDSQNNFMGFRGVVRDITKEDQYLRQVRQTSERLRLIAENVPAVIAYVDTGERYQFCNSLGCMVLGLPSEQILGRTVLEVRGAQDYAMLQPHIQEVLGGNPAAFEGAWSIQSRLHHFQARYVPDKSADGRVLGFYAIFFDVTELKESEASVKQAVQRLHLIADNMPAAITHIDSERRFTFSNLTHARWLGRPATELLGRRVSEVHPAEIHDQLLPHLDAAFAGNEDTFTLSYGQHHFRGSYIPEKNHANEVTGVYALIHDVTRLKQIEDELRMLAQYDALTGLANRRRYGERLAEAIARSERSGHAMAVMFMDLDHFKRINDSLGHKAGDLVLQEFAHRLNACVRRTDTVARLAGDEFVIILDSVAVPDEAIAVARKIAAAMQPPFVIEGQQRNLSTSIGIAIRRPGEVDGEALLRRADSALYAAKARERGSFQLAG